MEESKVCTLAAVKAGIAITAVMITLAASAVATVVMVDASEGATSALTAIELRRAVCVV